MIYRYQPRTAHMEPSGFWMRHPHLGSILVWSAIIGSALMLTGCECGVGWPCPR